MELNCPYCGHSIKTNQHGFHDGQGHCTRCRECNPNLPVFDKPVQPLPPENFFKVLAQSLLQDLKKVFRN